MKKFKGTGVALVTPFKSDNSIDFDGLEKLVNHCVEGGVEYLVVMGTTAENPTLSAKEKTEVLNFVKKVNNGRKPIVYGIGGSNTLELKNALQNFDSEGVDGILSVSPYYSKPTQEGIYQHFKTLSEASPLPIILYNVPGRTSSNISAETTLRLARDFDNIVAVKEASGNLEQIMKICNERPDGFLVLSGDDNLTLPMLACGADGVISVSGQGFPKEFSEMVRQGLAGNFAKAQELHYQLFEITKMLFEEGNPAGIKVVLKEKGICESHLRQPLWEISDGLRKRIREEMKKRNI